LKRYRKVGLTWARPLTAEDYQALNGLIPTLEGPVRFEVGDYLCHGAHNDFWPIQAEKFLATKEYLTGQPEPAEGEYAMYSTKGTVQAEQLFEEFETELGSGEKLKGRPGDYRVKDQAGHEWVVAQLIFETSYTELPDEE
jgi:hypothetical protein